MKLRVPLLWLAALLAAPQVTAQTSPAPRPDLHDGLRRWAVGPFAYGLYAPNGPGVFGGGLRYTYALYRNLDVDGALGLLYAYDTSNLSRHGLLVEGGLVASGSIAGGTTTRVGAFASTGFLFNEDGPAVTGYFGVEFRAGGALRARPESGGAERWGVDLRFRTGIRLFGALDGVNVLTPAYGIELGFGFGRGGSRPIRSGSDTWRAIEQIEDAAHNAFHDLTGGRVAFAACYADIPSEVGPVRAEARGLDEGRDEDIHVCPSSERAALQTPPTTGCSLYLAAVPDGSDAQVSLSLDTSADAPVGSFDAGQGVTALLVCRPTPAPARASAVEERPGAASGANASTGVTVHASTAATVNVSDTAPRSVTVSATTPTNVTVTAPGTARVTVNAPAPTNVTVNPPAQAAPRTATAASAASLQGRSTASDAAHRAIATRIPVPWPQLVDAAHVHSAANGTLAFVSGEETRSWLVTFNREALHPCAQGTCGNGGRVAGATAVQAAFVIPFSANHVAEGRLCVYAPGTAGLSVAFSDDDREPTDDKFHALRWDGEEACEDLRDRDRDRHLWLRLAEGARSGVPWPILVAVRGRATAPATAQQPATQPTTARAADRTAALPPRLPGAARSLTPPEGPSSRRAGVDRPLRRLPQREEPRQRAENRRRA